MTTNTPPADLDRRALELARSLAAIDRERLKGGKEQFIAILHSAIVEAAMMHAQAAKKGAAQCGPN